MMKQVFQKDSQRPLPPFIRSSETVQRMTWKVIVSLLPVITVSLFFYSLLAAKIFLVSIMAGLAGQVMARLILRKKTQLLDGSGLLTALLLAVILPPTLPLWMAALGAFGAVFIAGELFGGTGQYTFHPVLVAHAFLAASFPLAMNYYVAPFDLQEAITPLMYAHAGNVRELSSLKELFLGTYAGGLGTTCVLAVFAGSLLLFWQRLLFWEMPLLFLGTVAFLSYLTGAPVWVNTLSGTTFFAAFYFLTDCSTTPHTNKGLRVYAVLAGTVLFLVRRYSVYPDGVSFALLFAGMWSPWIDMMTKPRGTQPFIAADWKA